MAKLQMKEKAILLRDEDDVAVAKEKLTAGMVLSWDERSIEIRQDVPIGHKIALRSIRSTEPLRKYGQVIGFATEDIAVGDWVHLHNLGMGALEQEYEVGTDVKEIPFCPDEQVSTFDGYDRNNGRVGTRNYVALLTTVNCAASTARFIRERFKTEDIRRDFPNVDGVIALSHKYG